ncbi:hypothetical protein LX36DRAFT_527897, partial [Colletotrichum falcatum]
GNCIAEFNKNGLHVGTEYGLDFVAQNTIENQCIRDVVEAIIDRPRWGLYKVYSDKLPSDQVWFLHNRIQPQTPTLLVLLLSPGSSTIFWEGSHLKSLYAKEEKEWGLLALPREWLAQKGIKPTEVSTCEGGLAIIDSRTGFTPVRGYAIHIGFATEAELEHWAKMPLPDSETLRAKVADLESKGFRSNITFVK